jgi:hypothetical protein
MISKDLDQQLGKRYGQKENESDARTDSAPRPSAAATVPPP